MGKTSVYLPEELAVRVKASGVPMAELIRRGLDADEPPPLEEIVRRAVRSELEARDGGGRETAARIKIVTDERMPAGVAALVAPGPEGTEVRAVNIGGGAQPDAPPAGDRSEGTPAMRRASDLQPPARCPHKGIRVTGGWCKTCQADVKPGGRLPEGWVRPEGWSES